MEQQPNQQPQVGTHQATVKETTDLLKKLSEFSSKKEDVLKRLSEISNRMQSRLGQLNGEKPPAGEEESQMPPYLKNISQVSIPGRAMDVKFTRVRETPKPVFVDGCLNIALPNKQAINDDWKSCLGKMGDHPISCGLCNYDDESISFSPGGMATLATGIKLSIPSGVSATLATFPGLTILAPTFVTEHQHDKELLVTVRNETSECVKLLYGVPLFTLYFVRFADGVRCEELLNSTYEDWVHGTIGQ